MARGGFRPGAGRKPDPNSARQRMLAARAARKAAKEAAGGAQKAATGFTLPNGQKAPDAPAGWPFGTVPPAAPAAAPATPAAESAKRLTAREYLSALVNDAGADEKLRLDAAKRLIEFEEPKPAPMGKKEARAEAAKKVGSKFAATAPPKLVVANGSRVG